MKKKENFSAGSFKADRVSSYFKAEWGVLAAVTVSGLIYNIGLLAGPWFEGLMTGCLVDILGGRKGFNDMLVLVLAYVIVIGIVQASRYIKRFYVRRFANNVNRRMKHVLYGSLVRKSRQEINEEGVGNVMTKAILDVDDCAEGMRKFTTEVFDTGVALLAYMGMLLWYDWRLAIISLLFPPISYVVAEKMKVVVQRTGVAYKKQSGILSDATLDRASNAITYRVFGCEEERKKDYENKLTAYEKAAVKANIWNTVMTPLYRVMSMIGVIFILYFGGKNVLGTGWKLWDIAAFTTFLSCFTKLSVKSSKAAKLFNAVHKAQVSWKRIKPLMKIEDAGDEENSAAKADSYGNGDKVVNGAADNDMLGDNNFESSSSEKKYDNKKTSSINKVGKIEVNNLGFGYPNVPGNAKIFEGISFEAQPGQIIGITGAVACGKSTLGKVFLCEYPYDGSIKVDGKELCELGAKERAGLVGYLGHDTELFADTVRNNILLGDDEDVNKILKTVCFDGEVAAMENGADTMVGTGGVRLSGGQAQRLALARTICHGKPVMVLDDPFSALDKNTEKQVYDNLRSISRNEIVFLISHRLYMFPKMDKIIWLENGSAKVGTHDELMKKVPEYARLYNDQKGGGADEA